MTPEIWQAKKVVDSTLHPGMGRKRRQNFWLANRDRYRATGLPTIPHVLLRYLEPDRNRWHAYARATSTQRPADGPSILMITRPPEHSSGK